jgi:NitT/TauT family transport system permease protein
LKHVDRWIVLAGLIAAWEILPRYGLMDPFFMSQPTLVLARLQELALSGELWRHFVATMEEAVIGFTLGTSLGIGAGLWCALNDRVSAALVPIATAGNALPLLAFAPLFVTWFGFGIASKVALATVVVFFFVFFGVYSGVRSSDQVVVSNARLMGGRGWDMLRHVYLPSAVGWIMASMRLGVAYCMAAVVVGEYLGAHQGVGFIIVYGMNMLNMTDVFAGIVVVTAIVATLDFAVRGIAARGASWRIDLEARG